MQRAVALFLVVATSLVALPQKALTNEDIIKMVKGGLPDDVILLAIESQPSNFDVSPKALVELKQQGVSKAVLDKIIEVPAASRRTAAPPSQVPPEVAPPSSGPIQTLSPADEQRLRTLVEQASSQARRVFAQPMEQNVHELLDQGLSCENMPDPVKVPCVALFAPYRQAFHRFLDQTVPRLRQQLHTPSQPRSEVKRPGPFLRPVLWTGGKAFASEVRPDPMVGSRRRSALRPYRDPARLLPDAQPTCGETRRSQSGSEGDATQTVTFIDWVDAPDSIASGGGIEIETTVDPKVPVQGIKSGKQSFKAMSGACVDRCPTADGKVAGRSEFEWAKIVEVTATTGAVAVDRDLTSMDVIAEGRVGEDARLREVVVQADWSVEKRAGSQLTIVRGRGTATFDPHGTDDEVPLQLTGCSGNQGILPVAQCSGWAALSVGTLRDTYLRAERKWNLEQEAGTAYEPGSRCVIAKFTPPTDTVQGNPNQQVPVKTELIAVKGNQPTWGVLKELSPIPTGDGEIKENGTPTSPDAPAQLTYTAPSKQWPCNGPPGFGVYKATSRAGALDLSDNGVGYQHDDWSWFLAPGCLRLSIHERTEVQFMIVSSLSEITFPMDLTVNQGQVTGQAVVQRESRTLVSVANCGGVDHWMENWHASGTLDEKTDTLTLKLWFEATTRQGTGGCNIGPGIGSDQGPVGPPGGPMTFPHSSPGFRSDSFPSPLDRFTLAAKEGATQHFVIPFTAPARHTIDVTVALGLGGGAAK